MTDPTLTPDATASAPAPADEQTVPYERFAKLEASRNDLQARLETLQEKAATVDTLAARLAETEAKALAAESRFSTWRDLSAALGTTDQEALEAAEWAHSKLPSEGRPPIGDWISTVKADPSTAPKVLAPWLAQDPGPDPAPATPEPKRTPRPPKASPTPPASPPSVSADSIRAARDEGVRTGDWTRYRELASAAGYRK